MDIFSFFTLGGGLAFFLFGMSTMSSNLEKMAGGKLEKTLKSMTSNLFRSIVLGCGITVAIQSSSALTVMLVGFVNSGIMQLKDTIGVIMGSNIGTTLTSWILSLEGINSEVFWLRMLKPQSFSPIVALAGAALMLFGKKQKRRDIGEIMLGFAVLMFGMQLMSSAVEPLAESDAFAEILLMFSNPLLGVLISTLFTSVIQSSAATVGILQALARTGAISGAMALPIVMGANIGTCATALLSSIGAHRSGKRVAYLHVTLKILGTVLVCLLFYPLNALLDFAFVDQPISTFGVALIHTVFNLFNTAIMMPFVDKISKAAFKLYPEKGETKKTDFLLDERLLATPSIAISECRRYTIEMAELAKSAFFDAVKMIFSYDDSVAKTIVKREDIVDRYEDHLGTYLVKLSSRELTDTDSKRISELLHTIGDFERISDHALNLLDSAKEMHTKKISFSSDALAELHVMVDALEEILDNAITAFEYGDLELAARVEPLEEVIDLLQIGIKERHIERLRHGKCTIELGFILSDIIANCERVSDHCSNIAVCIIEIERESDFETHAYIAKLRKGENEIFKNEYDKYLVKYSLPLLQ